MRGRLLLLAFGAGLVAGQVEPAGAAQPAAPRLSRVVLGTSPVSAGGTLAFFGVVGNLGGSAVRPRIAVYLSARAAGGRLWLGEIAPGRVPVGDRRRFRGAVPVPVGTRSGRYGVLMCARARGGWRSRCVRAGPVRVTGEASALPGRFRAGARSVGDELYPAIGNGGYDALAYRLTLAYRPGTRVLGGRGEMTALATQDLRSFSLDLQGLAVRRITVDGVPAFFRRQATKLLISPTAGIPAGQRLAVSVDYSGVVRPVREPSSGPTGFLPTRAGATVVSQPIGAQNWFPCNNTPADKALFDVSMRVPRGLEVLGNGRLVSRRRTGPWTAFRWVEDQPMATYLATATLGRYQIVRARTASGLPLYSGLDRAAGQHGRPPSRRRLARRRALLDRIGPVIGHLERLLGPYPFASAGGIVANAPDLEDALETQTRPVYAGEFDTQTQIHELAHQWFGDTVTITRHRDMWLHEGFATWATWWATHQINPRAPTTAQAAARVYRRSERHHGNLRELWRPAIVTRPQDLFGDAVYERGGMLLEALRQRTGDPVFRRILRDWLAEHAYANATTADFIALSERDSGQHLDDFFDDWLHTIGKPTTTPPRAHG